MSDKIKDAFGVLKKALKDDPAYAHGWHCNIAVMCQDAIHNSDSPSDDRLAYDIGNDAASRFMKLCFDVNTSSDMLLTVAISKVEADKHTHPDLADDALSIKIIEIIPEDIPEWAVKAMASGQLFRESLSRIKDLESKLSEWEDKDRRSYKPRYSPCKLMEAPLDISEGQEFPFGGGSMDE